MLSCQFLGFELLLSEKSCELKPSSHSQVSACVQRGLFFSFLIQSTDHVKKGSLWCPWPAGFRLQAAPPPAQGCHTLWAAWAQQPEHLTSSLAGISLISLFRPLGTVLNFLLPSALTAFAKSAESNGTSRDAPAAPSVLPDAQARGTRVRGTKCQCFMLTS